MEDILIACIDGLKGFPEAVEAIFPKTKVRLCIVHQIRSSMRYVLPRAAKSDNMRQWVSKSNRYEPVFTEMLEQWANHNFIALLTARAYGPKDRNGSSGLDCFLH